MTIINNIKDTIKRVMLILGVILFFSVMNQNIRILIGQSINIIMEPYLQVIGKSNFYLIIFILSIVTAFYSYIIQKNMIDQNKLIELQQKMKKIQNEINESKKNNNSILLKKLEEEQIKQMRKQTEFIKDQIKPMFYIVLLSLPIFMWIYYYINQNPGIYMCFPIWGDQLLADSIFYTFQYWIYWYFITSISFGQIIKKISISRM